MELRVFGEEVNTSYNTKNYSVILGHLIRDENGSYMQ